MGVLRLVLSALQQPPLGGAERGLLQLAGDCPHYRLDQPAREEAKEEGARGGQNEPSA